MTGALVFRYVSISYRSATYKASHKQQQKPAPRIHEDILTDMLRVLIIINLERYTENINTKLIEKTSL